MARLSRLLTKDVYEKLEERLQGMGKQGQEFYKLTVMKCSFLKGITNAAEFFGTTKPTIISWIKHFREERFDMLHVQKGRGPKHILDKEQRQIVQTWLKQNSQITIMALKERIETEWNVNISRTSVHRLMKNLGFSYITPRPRHYKQNPQDLEDLKKKSHHRHPQRKIR